MRVDSLDDMREHAVALAELEVRATRLSKLLQRATAELARRA